jgi:hypothetical protein
MLQLDPSVRPRWYFDWTDSWQPALEEEARFQFELDDDYDYDYDEDDDTV